MSVNVDILLLTTAPGESEAVINVCTEKFGRKPVAYSMGERTYHDIGEINGSRIFLARCQQGSGGVGGSQEEARIAIETLHPSTVIMLGFAFGVNPEKQEIGDILVARQLRLYDLQRIGTGKQNKQRVVLRGDRPPASARLVNWLDSAALDWDKNNGRVQFGLVLTGDKLVDNLVYREQLISLEPEAIGGEMEGAGLYVSCHNKKVDWIIVKAICDWAANKEDNKEANQSKAAYNAAQFVTHAIGHAKLLVSPSRLKVSEAAIPDRSAALEAEKRYRELALESCDIINLSNLPEDDRHVATRQLELRRLYVPLHVRLEAAPSENSIEAELRELERRRSQSQKAPLWTDIDDAEDETERFTIGERLDKSRRLIVLGDPGAGKTTMTRWLATAYLLRLSKDMTWKDIPDVASLPNYDWLPIIIRCRDLDSACGNLSLSEILEHTFRKAEMTNSQVEMLKVVLQEKLQMGQALLMIDGLDEIPDPALRTRFCQQVEQICVAYPQAPIILTSRIVGYREMAYRIGRGFEHITVADLSRKDKDDFARRWCSITEAPERRSVATKELIQDIHSNDRIERLTKNPMLLTTMALVKRKIGRLPSRRAELYAGALEVLLNWRREIDTPLDSREAVPQLEYIAYAMCDRGIQQLREDEIIELLDVMREEYPQIRTIHGRPSEEFLSILERKTGILVQAGTTRHNGRETPIFEFRHLTFQEYLAGLALVDGRFPRRDRSKSIADCVAILASQTSVVIDKDGKEVEVVVTESWREALRLCVSSCNDDDIDDVIKAIHLPTEQEEYGKTTRPRVILAALCLADEPNVSEHVALSVINGLIEQIDVKDGKGPINTGIDAASKELANSQWAKAIQRGLIEQFLICPAPLRSNVGGLAGMVGGMSAPIEPAELDYWFEEQIQQIISANKASAIASSLSIMDMAYHGKTTSNPELVQALFPLLYRDAPSAHAAAWVLSWLNREALEGASWRPSISSLEEILNILTRPGTDVMATMSLMRILGRERFLPAVPEICARLRDEQDQIRSTAASVLGKIGSPDAVEPLLSALEDKSNSVVASTLSALAALPDSRSIKPLAAKLQEDDVSISWRAAYALSRINDNNALNELIGSLNDSQFVARARSAWALGETKNAKAVIPLITALADSHTYVRKNAADALGEISDLRAVEPLVNMLQDEDTNVKVSVVNALGKIADDLSISALTKALHDTSANVQAAAHSALHGIALRVFKQGNIEKSLDIFNASLSSRDNDHVRNNIAFCKILLNELDQAYDQFSAMEFRRNDSSWPLFQHNLGVLRYLQKDSIEAKWRLEESLSRIKEDRENHNDSESPDCMLLVNDNGTTWVPDMPVDVACIVNLCRMGIYDINNARLALSDYSPIASQWIHLLSRT